MTDQAHDQMPGEPRIIEVTLSERQLIDEANSLAEWGGCASRQEAFERLDAGDFEGTILACELSGVRSLLDEYQPLAAE